MSTKNILFLSVPFDFMYEKLSIIFCYFMEVKIHKEIEILLKLPHFQLKIPGPNKVKGKMFLFLHSDLNRLLNFSELAIELQLHELNQLYKSLSSVGFSSAFPLTTT